ncbi:MAG: hypothetical protein HKM91_01135 [Altererythrobacter sp.]|nr:hypothetical protein [Altererythrobacter sp.]
MVSDIEWMKSSRTADIAEGGTRVGSLTFTKLIAALVLIGAASACSVQTEPVITASQGSAVRTVAVSLVPPDEEQTDRTALYDALALAFEADGISLSENAPFVAEFAMSSNNAEAAIYLAQAGTDNPEPEMIVDVRDRKFIDECKAARFRAQLVMFDRSSGSISSTATAESISCLGDVPPYDQIATLLVSRLVSN